MTAKAGDETVLKTFRPRLVFGCFVPAASYRLQIGQVQTEVRPCSEILPRIAR